MSQSEEEAGTSNAVMNEAKIKEMFTVFDTEGRDMIRTDQVGPLLRGLGINPTERQISMLIKENDPSESGWVSRETFTSMAIPLMGGRSPALQLLSAFHTFDKDGRNKISTAELRYIISNIGEPLPDDEVEEFLSFADREGTGEVAYQELIKALLDEH